MTIEEAIKYLRMATDEAGNEEFSDVYKEMCSMSINALEKQMPKKTDVKIHDEDTRIGSVIFQRGTKVHYCPQCRMLVTGSEKYCRSCGQALIW